MTNVTVKAIIKYNEQDAQRVLYYKTPERVIKMTNKKKFIRMGTWTTKNAIFKQARDGWSRAKETVFIYEDEQPLLNGEPIELDGLVPFEMSEDEIKSFEVGAKPITKKKEKRGKKPAYSFKLAVSKEIIRSLRSEGHSAKAVAEILECSVSTVYRKEAA